MSAAHSTETRSVRPRPRLGKRLRRRQPTSASVPARPGSAPRVLEREWSTRIAAQPRNPSAPYYKPSRRSLRRLLFPVRRRHSSCPHRRAAARQATPLRSRLLAAVTFRVHREPLLCDAEFLHRRCEPLWPLLLALSPRRRAAASPASRRHHRLLVSASVAPTPSPRRWSSSSPRGYARAPHRASSCSTAPPQDQRGRDAVIQRVRGVEFQHDRLVVPLRPRGSPPRSRRLR
jgi:hypothetical protein